MVLSIVLLGGILFQNTLVYRCNRLKEHLPHGAYLLPSPIIHRSVYKFEKDNVSPIIHLFLGNGASVNSSLWHIGQIYSACNCSIYAYESLVCMDDTEFLFGPSYSDFVKHVDFQLFTNLQPRRHNVLFGVSLGNAYILATYWNQNLISGIIFENPFTSIFDLIAFHVNYYVALIVKPFIRINWRNDVGITHVHSDIPVLFLTSGADEIAPPYMSSILMKKSHATRIKQVILTDSLHGHASSHPLYQPAISEFIKQIIL